MSDRISDSPPLLPAGEHILTPDELRDIGVYKFPLSKTRRDIGKGIDRMLDGLAAVKILGELVVDGSFLTEEIDPSDVDFTLIVTPTFYELCNREQRKILEWVRDDFSIKVTHLCDCYLCVEYQEGHPDYFDGIQNRSYWINLYSKSVVYKRVRGVAIIRLEE
jgi:hypothetical protein